MTGVPSEIRVRFDVGSQYAGQIGTVVRVKPRRSGRRLDYWLCFRDGFSGWFFDTEVEPLTTDDSGASFPAPAPSGEAAPPPGKTDSGGGTAASESGEGMCPHGRPSWNMCPHCMGFARGTQ